MWDFFAPAEKTWHCWRLNGAAAYIRKDGDNWEAAFSCVPARERIDAFGRADDEPPPESLARVFASSAGERVFLHPFFLPASYAIRLGALLRVAPERSFRLSVDLPPLLKFETAPGREIASFEPFKTSKAFVGPDLMRGEICRAIDLDLSRAGGVLKDGAPSAFIRCEVTIVNGSKAPLELESFVIDPEPLSVYAIGEALVADALELSFVDGECRPRASKCEDARSRLLSAGVRYSVGESFARRSADIIKDIASIQVGHLER